MARILWIRDASSIRTMAPWVEYRFVSCMIMAEHGV